MFEKNLAKLIEGTTDVAFAVDNYGEIRLWNKAAEKLLQYSKNEVIGSTCSEIIHGQSASDKSICREACDILECTKKQREINNFDMQTKDRAGNRIWVNVSLLRAIDERTDRQLTVHFMRDVTERKRSEMLTDRMLKLAKDLLNGTYETDSLPPVSPLTTQEINVLRKLAGGLNTAQITKELKITMPTLRNHLNNINKKLHTKSRVEAVAEAMKRKLI